MSSTLSPDPSSIAQVAIARDRTHGPLRVMNSEPEPELESENILSMLEGLSGDVDLENLAHHQTHHAETRGAMQVPTTTTTVAQSIPIPASQLDVSLSSYDFFSLDFGTDIPVGSTNGQSDTYGTHKVSNFSTTASSQPTGTTGIAPKAVGLERGPSNTINAYLPRSDVVTAANLFAGEPMSEEDILRNSMPRRAIPAGDEPMFTLDGTNGRTSSSGGYSRSPIMSGISGSHVSDESDDELTKQAKLQELRNMLFQLLPDNTPSSTNNHEPVVPFPGVSEVKPTLDTEHTVRRARSNADASQPPINAADLLDHPPMPVIQGIDEYDEEEEMKVQALRRALEASGQDPEKIERQVHIFRIIQATTEQNRHHGYKEVNKRDISAPIYIVGSAQVDVQALKHPLIDSKNVRIVTEDPATLGSGRSSTDSDSRKPLKALGKTLKIGKKNDKGQGSNTVNHEQLLQQQLRHQQLVLQMKHAALNMGGTSGRSHSLRTTQPSPFAQTARSVPPRSGSQNLMPPGGVPIRRRESSLGGARPVPLQTHTDLGMSSSYGSVNQLGTSLPSADLANDIEAHYQQQQQQILQQQQQIQQQHEYLRQQLRRLQQEQMMEEAANEPDIKLQRQDSLDRLYRQQAGQVFDQRISTNSISALLVPDPATTGSVQHAGTGGLGSAISAQLGAGYTNESLAAQIAAVLDPTKMGTKHTTTTTTTTTTETAAKPALRPGATLTPINGKHTETSSSSEHHLSSALTGTSSHSSGLRSTVITTIAGSYRVPTPKLSQPTSITQPAVSTASNTTTTTTTDASSTTPLNRRMSSKITTSGATSMWSMQPVAANKRPTSGAGPNVTAVWKTSANIEATWSVNANPKGAAKESKSATSGATVMSNTEDAAVTESTTTTTTAFVTDDKTGTSLTGKSVSSVIDTISTVPIDAKAGTASIEKTNASQVKEDSNQDAFGVDSQSSVPFSTSINASQTNAILAEKPNTGLASSVLESTSQPSQPSKYVEIIESPVMSRAESIREDHAKMFTTNAAANVKEKYNAKSDLNDSEHASSSRNDGSVDGNGGVSSREHNEDAAKMNSDAQPCTTATDVQANSNVHMYEPWQGPSRQSSRHYHRDENQPLKGVRVRKRDSAMSVWSIDVPAQAPLPAKPPPPMPSSSHLPSLPAQNTLGVPETPCAPNTSPMPASSPSFAPADATQATVDTDAFDALVATIAEMQLEPPKSDYAGSVYELWEDEGDDYYDAYIGGEDEDDEDDVLDEQVDINKNEANVQSTGRTSGSAHDGEMTASSKADSEASKVASSKRTTTGQNDVQADTADVSKPTTHTASSSVHIMLPELSVLSNAEDFSMSFSAYLLDDAQSGPISYEATTSDSVGASSTAVRTNKEVKEEAILPEKPAAETSVLSELNSFDVANASTFSAYLPRREDINPDRTIVSDALYRFRSHTFAGVQNSERMPARHRSASTAQEAEETTDLFSVMASTVTNPSAWSLTDGDTRKDGLKRQASVSSSTAPSSSSSAANPTNTTADKTNSTGTQETRKKQSKVSSSFSSSPNQYCRTLRAMSHFPDLSELASPPLSSGSAAPPVSNSTSQSIFDTDDPTADFLARERAVLGDDVHQILGSSSSNTAAPPFSTSSLNSRRSASDMMDMDIPAATSVSAPISNTAKDPETSAFERNFPPLDDATHALATSTVAFHSYSTVSTKSSGFSSHFGQDEPEFIREWRERQAAIIAERESRAADEKAKRIEQARKAIDRFYEDYNAKREKAIAENRASQEAASYGTDGANVWERACRIADLVSGNDQVKKQQQSKTARDTSRMRNLLLDLRKDPKAPGVATAP